VKCGNSQTLALFSNILGGKHGSIRGGFISISLNLHSTGNADKGLTAGKVSNVYKGIIEGCEEVGNGEDFFLFSDFDSTDSSRVYSWF
jgi:hypothetical protein